LSPYKRRNRIFLISQKMMNVAFSVLSSAKQFSYVVHLLDGDNICWCVILLRHRNYTTWQNMIVVPAVWRKSTDLIYYFGFLLSQNKNKQKIDNLEILSYNNHGKVEGQCKLVTISSVSICYWYWTICKCFKLWNSYTKN